MPLYLNGTEGVYGVNGTNSTPANRGSDTNTGIVYGTDTVQIATGGTTAVTVDSSQNVGIGTASPAYKLDILGALAVRRSTVSARVSTLSNENGNFEITADSNYNMVFKTGGSETARIDTSGKFLLGATSSTGGYGGYKFLISDTTPMIKLQSTTGAPNAWDIYLDSGSGNLYFAYNGSDKGNFNKTTGAYTALSDSRVKKNVEPCSYGLSQVLSLQPVVYHMVEEADDAKKHLGFIAQEVKSIIDEAVDDVPADKFYGLDKSGLVPVLVKAIQELSAKLDAAEARIAALEAK